MNGENPIPPRRRRTLSAVASAFLEHKPAIRALVARFFADGQDIEDVVQEAFLRAYAAERHTAIKQPKVYLLRIAKHIALNKLSKKTEQITDRIEECGAWTVLEGVSAADREVEAEELLGLYCQAVARLPEKCRQVYLLRKVHGLTHKQIARRMALSVSSVEKYLVHGILQCRAYVQEREERTGSAPAAGSRKRSA